MINIESSLLILLIILFLGLVIPELFKKLRFPLMSIVILIGAILGPNGLNFIRENEIISFFGFLGMTFLMLMAGIDTNISKLKEKKKKIITMALFNGLIPFIVGVLVTKYFGYSWTTSMIIGIIFISSSVAIIIPTLNSNKVIRKETGHLILSAILLLDILSLILLGIFFQNIAPITKLPLPLYFIILIASIFFLFYLIPKISSLGRKRFSTDEGYERSLRFIIIIIIGTLAYFTFIGVHPILASFLVGISLSTLIKKDKTGHLYLKLHTISYGLFVPVFFFIVGMEMNLKLLKNFNIGNIIMISLIFSLISSKIISGYLGGKFAKLSKKDSWAFGTISITQLTTTLAVTFAASTLGILDEILVTSIILISIITTFLSPVILSLFPKIKPKPVK